MSQYEIFQAEWDRAKAKQNGKIAALALRTAHDKLNELYNNSQDRDARATGYRDGVLAAMILLAQMVTEFENGPSVSKKG